MSKSDIQSYLKMAHDLALAVPESISQFAQNPQAPRPSSEEVRTFLSTLIKTASRKMDPDWITQKPESPFRVESALSQRRWTKTPRVLTQIEGTPVRSWMLDSNEDHLDFFFPFIAQRKGLLVGPATDASLSLIASGASAGAILTDVSPWALIKMLIIGTFTSKAASPAEFVAQMEAVRNTRTLPPTVTAQLSADSQRFIKKHDKPLILSNPGYYNRLTQDDQSWLSSQARYDRVRQLFGNRQIRLMHGSLVDGKTWQMINLQVQENKTPVDTLYWSNINIDGFQNETLLEAKLKSALAPDAQVLRTTVSQKGWDYHVTDFRLIAPFLGVILLHHDLGDFMNFVQEFMSAHPNNQLAVSGFEKTDEIVAQVVPDTEIEAPTVEAPLPAETIIPVTANIAAGVVLPSLVPLK